MTNLTLVGNLAADPELRFSNNGKAMCKFTVMTSKSRKNDAGEWGNTDVTGWAVTVWEQAAENCANTLQKGDPVVVLGDAVWRSWQNDDGSKGGRMEVRAWNVGLDLRRFAAVPQRNAPKPAKAAIEDDPWAADAPPF